VKSNPILQNLFGNNTGENQAKPRENWEGNSNSHYSNPNPSFNGVKGGKENPVYVVVQEGKTYYLIFLL
jgi:hypothetical protein